MRLKGSVKSARAIELLADSGSAACVREDGLLVWGAKGFSAPCGGWASMRRSRAAGASGRVGFVVRVDSDPAAQPPWVVAWRARSRDHGGAACAGVQARGMGRAQSRVQRGEQVIHHED